MGINYETRYLYPFKNYAYNEFDTSDVVDLSLINELRHVVLISPNASFDFRDSKIRPRIGGVISTQFTASHGFNSLQDDFVKAEADVRFFLPVSKFTTLALRGAGGKAMPYGKNDKVAMDRLFSIGGTRTVRGFREGELWLTNDGYPILGYSALYYSAELRSAIGNIEIPIFADFGTITDKNNADFKPIKYSVGGGINYITPIGPIGLFYAVPIDVESRRRNSEANRTGIPGVIHFSIGYSF
jgi:outer membrane protein insertion porin family